MSAPEITWTCGVCHKPIEGDTGSIFTRVYREEEAYRQAVADWEAKYPADPSGFRELPWEALKTIPKRIPWRVTHFECDPDDSGTYDISIGMVRTHRGLSDLTAHLLEKEWFDATDWSQLLRKAIKGSAK